MDDAINDVKKSSTDDGCANVVARLSAFQATMRESASMIDAHAYMQLADKLRDLEEAITELRRSL
jgi:hypothetical protein